MKNHKLIIVAIAISILAFGSLGALGKFPWGKVTVNPNTGLTDGQTVQISGTDFQKNRDLRIIECGPLQQQQKGGYETAICTYYNVVVTTDANGNFSPTNFTVSTLIQGYRWSHGHNRPATYNCLPANDCHIHVYASSGGPGADNQDISFSP